MLNEKKYIIDRSNRQDPNIIFDYDNCERQLKRIDDLLDELDNMISKKYDRQEDAFPVNDTIAPAGGKNDGIVDELDHVLDGMRGNMLYAPAEA